MARQHRFRLLTRLPGLAHRSTVLGLALLLSPLTALQAQSEAEVPTPVSPAPTPEEHLEDEPPPPPHPRFGGRGRKHGRGERPPMPPPPADFELNKLSPEERQRFDENKRRWEALSSEEKEALRQHHKERMTRMRKTVDRAIEQSGLTLTKEQQREFAHRFMSERRKIERELRHEMNRKRDEAVDALVKRLATEFKESAGAEKAVEKSE